MNELTKLKERLDNVRFICELSEQDQSTIEHLARFEASIMGFNFERDFLNEKAWCAVELIDRIEDMVLEAINYNNQSIL